MFDDRNTTLLPVGVPTPFVPGAFYNPLPNATRGRLMTPTQIILHTNAGSKSSTWRNLFSWSSRNSVTDPGTTQPHFQVQIDGQIGQGLPLDRQGVHARFANVRAIGIETQDAGYGSKPTDNDPWSPAQIDAIVRICTHACLFYNIPVQLPKTWDSPGIAHHAYFGYPKWSKYAGKTCPGKARTGQVLEVLVKTQENLDAIRKMFG